MGLFLYLSGVWTVPPPPFTLKSGLCRDPRLNFSECAVVSHKMEESLQTPFSYFYIFISSTVLSTGEKTLDRTSMDTG